MNLFESINATIQTLETDSIPAARKGLLRPLAEVLKRKIGNGEAIRLNFICTHNSRRSHLSQVWAQALAAYFDIPNVHCYSGGSEATALYPMAAEALRNAGFTINRLSLGTNPVYSIKYAGNAHPIIGFSKTMDDDFNPKSEFMAIMTCSQADEACPVVPGAEQRFSLPYEDPKAFDNTPRQAEKYKERSLQIATELYYVFEQATGS